MIANRNRKRGRNDAEDMSGFDDEDAGPMRRPAPGFENENAEDSDEEQGGGWASDDDESPSSSASSPLGWLPG